jgi:cytochrome c556
MMGGNSMMGTETGVMRGAMISDDIAAMPVDGAFAMVSQVCSACHTQFRAESK